jgi:excisionase family DNA binding protein
VVLTSTTAVNVAADLLDGRLTLRIKEASALLGLPPQTLRNHIRRGDIRGVRIGKGRRAITLIPVEEIRRILSGAK